MWGDVFVREEFQHERRSDLIASKPRRDDLYDDVFGDFNDAYRRSRLVQLILEHKPNGRHRAEVQKLLVLREFRGRGIAKALMAALERKAAELGRSLLVLDTVPGQPAEKLYERLGYRRAGVVPDYAEKSSGGFEPTVIFYKKLI